VSADIQLAFSGKRNLPHPDEALWGLPVHLPNPERGKRHHVCDWIGAEYAKSRLVARRKRYILQFNATARLGELLEVRFSQSSLLASSAGRTARVVSMPCLFEMGPREHL
jgi:hypothetical protein